MTVVEIEEESLKRLSASPRADVPKVPFGFQNEKWLAFKARIEEGDHLVKYRSEPASWKRLMGEEGYARLRGRCVKDKIITLVN
jgi:hypothetical protein